MQARSIPYIGRMRREGGSRMTGFLLRRLLNYVVLLVLASFLTFGLAPDISIRSTVSCSATRRRHRRLSTPKPPSWTSTSRSLRYAKWVSGAVHGDFGVTVGGQPVSQELWRRVGVSLRLVVTGSVLGRLLGVIVGAWGAVRQYN